MGSSGTGNRARHTIVTSFNLEGQVRYGDAFIETFAQYWPPTVDLVTYIESGVEVKRGGTVDLDDVIDWVRFDTAIRPFALMKGLTPGGYHINFDARMARKSFIMRDAVNRFGGKVFWIDADTITHSQVPKTFLDECLPDDKMNCHLSRAGWYYTESGFMGWNSAQPDTRKFLDAIANLFLSGTIFTLPGWHDCFAFDAIREHYPHPELLVNLADGLPKGCMHPFVNSCLGAYMDHRKGGRKSSRSTKEDLVIERSEPYWNV